MLGIAPPSSAVDMHRFHNWRAALQYAPDSAAIIEIIRQYLAVLPAEEIEMMPLECRLVLTDPAPDIHGAALTLLHQELTYSGDEAVAAVLHEAAHTFAAASVRLGQLHGRGEPTPQA